MSHRLWFIVVGMLLLSGAVPSLVEAASSSVVRSVATLYAQKQWERTASKAQRALGSKAARLSVKQRARLYVLQGAALHQMKHPAVAWRAFEKALKLNPNATLPANSTTGMRRLFARAKKKFAPQPSGLTKPPTRPVPKASGGGRAHVGWILGWVSVALTGGALGVAAVSGGNAFVNAQEASNLMRAARRNSYSQVMMEPIVSELHGRATTYGMVANISYGVAGATGLAATGFFLWAYFATRPKASSTKVSLPNTTPMLPQHVGLPNGTNLSTAGGQR